MPRIAIIGVGLIGRAWANVFARAGWDVSIYDSSVSTLEAAPDLISESLHNLAAHGLVDDPQTATKRIHVATSLEHALEDVEFVQESGPERIDAKQALFSQLDALAPGKAILASSSSAIVASRFTKELVGRERCLIAHPVNPPHVVPVVELCGAPWTSPDTVARARSTFESVGQVPVEVRREVDGFILNRMQAVLVAEALRLVGEGYCSADDLDKTIAHGLGLRWSFMGPFETIELNAPGGMADYFERFAETMLGLSESPVTPEIWSKENRARVLEDWGRDPTEEQVLSKSRWRDDRLAALVVHKRQQPLHQ